MPKCEREQVERDDGNGNDGVGNLWLPQTMKTTATTTTTTTTLMKNAPNKYKNKIEKMPKTPQYYVL